MRIVLLCLLFTSCASNSRIIRSERHDTYLVGLKCPDGYYLRASDLMCHFTNSVKLAKNKLEARVVKAKARKSVRMADRPLKIDCTRVMNQCFKGDL